MKNLHVKWTIQKDIIFCEEFLDNEMITIENKFQEDENIFEKYEIENDIILNFIDYIEFMEIENIYIYLNIYSNRVKNIINLLKDKMIYVNIYTVFDYGIQHEYVEDNDIYLRLYNSSFALQTGVYNLKEKIQIKHIETDSICDVQKFSSDNLVFFSFNSLIVTLNSSDIEVDKLISIVMTKDEFIKYNTENFIKKSESFIDDQINEYIETGKVNYFDGYYRDFGKYYLENKIYSLFIYDSKIYFDSNKKIFLSDDMQLPFYTMLNQLKPEKENQNYIMLREFFLCHYLSVKFKTNLKVIRSNIPGKIEAKSNIKLLYQDWMGLVFQNSHYLLNIKTQKLYQVKEQILESFELLIKGEDIKENYENEKLLGLLNEV